MLVAVDLPCMVNAVGIELVTVNRFAGSVIAVTFPAGTAFTE